MIYLLDTNVLCRFLVGDNQSHLEQAKKWFKQAEEGKIEIFVKPLIVAEACFVLESFYKVSRENIAESMLVFLSQRWLRVEDRDSLLSMWDSYKQGLHFIDSFLLAWQENIKQNTNQSVQIMTFDQELKKKQLT